MRAGRPDRSLARRVAAMIAALLLALCGPAHHAAASSPGRPAAAEPCPGHGEAAAPEADEIAADATPAHGADHPVACCFLPSAPVWRPLAARAPPPAPEPWAQARAHHRKPPHPPPREA